MKVIKTLFLALTMIFLVGKSYAANPTVYEVSSGKYIIRINAVATGFKVIALTLGANATYTGFISTPAAFSYMGNLQFAGTLNSSIPVTLDILVDVSNPAATWDFASDVPMDFFSGNFQNAIPLPVNFGNISATYSNGQLNVLWQTLKEFNNKQFEVQASLDGENFKPLGTVLSSATNGNSDIAINYSFSNSIKEATANMSLGSVAITLALLSLAFYGFRKRKMVLAGCAAFVMLSMGVVACQKTDSSVDTTPTNLWVRIAQTDIDGKVSYSKVVKVVEE